MLRRSTVETSIPTSSMADIAFLLLVFFLVTTHFLEDRGIGLLLPPVEQPPARLKSVMHFVVHDENDVIMKYKDEEMQMAASEISEFVRATLEENPLLVINLKPTRDAPYGAMIDVLDELRAADATRISLGQHRRAER